MGREDHWTAQKMKRGDWESNGNRSSREKDRDIFPSQESMELEEFGGEGKGVKGKLPEKRMSLDLEATAGESTDEESIKRQTENEPWVMASARSRTNRKKKFCPSLAARKSARTSRGGDYTNKRMSQGSQDTGMSQPTINSFTVLNSCDDNGLENIALNCDIMLGENAEEAREIISAMKLEELARANIAEANYRSHTQSILNMTHVLEGENLDLGKIDNAQRGEKEQQGGENVDKESEPQGVQQTKRQKKKQKGSRGDKLSRELKRISIK